MGKINDGTFRDWNNGETIGEADYEKEREILRVAINDNYDRIVDRYTKGETDKLIIDTSSGTSLAIEANTAFPSSPVAGRVVFRSDESNFYIYNGSVWEKLSGAESHISNTSNPHGVTTAQIGAIPSTEKGAVSGVATLDANGDVPVSQLDNVSTTYSYGNVSLSFTVNAGTTITHDITVVDKKLYDITLYNTFLTFDTNSTTSVWEDFWTPYNGASWNRVNVNDGTADLFELVTNDVYIRKIEKINSTTIRFTIINENTTTNRSVNLTLYYRSYN